MKHISKGVLLCGTLAFCLSFFPARAEQKIGELHLTWKTASYTPPGYRGKALPTPGSVIGVSAILVENGRSVSLLNQRVRWYVNDEIIKSGVGEIDLMTFVPTTGGDEYLDVRADLPDYAGLGGLQSVRIPIVRPDAVISHPYPKGEFSGNTLALRARPFFFNTTDPSRLRYEWSFNDQSPKNTEDPEYLSVSVPENTPDRYPLRVSLSIWKTNKDDFDDLATAFRTFTYLK